MPFNKKSLGNISLTTFLFLLLKEAYIILHILSGDLLQSDCNIIAHQCNCFAKMGAGIALQIKKLYPEAYEVDQQFSVPVGSKERLGKVSWTLVDHETKVVFNLYGQYKYERRQQQTDYGALEHALHEMFQVIDKELQDWSKIKIGMPYLIGCGLAGGDWTTVEKILLKISDQYVHDIYLYQLK